MAQRPPICDSSYPCACPLQPAVRTITSGGVAIAARPAPGPQEPATLRAQLRPPPHALLCLSYCCSPNAASIPPENFHNLVQACPRDKGPARPQHAGLGNSRLLGRCSQVLQTIGSCSQGLSEEQQRAACDPLAGSTAPEPQWLRTCPLGARYGALTARRGSRSGRGL